jgi:hypothetical protein
VADPIIEQSIRIEFTAPTKFPNRPLRDAIYKPATWVYDAAEIRAEIAQRVADHEAAVEAPPPPEPEPEFEVTAEDGTVVLV